MLLTLACSACCVALLLWMPDLWRGRLLGDTDDFFGAAARGMVAAPLVLYVLWRRRASSRAAAHDRALWSPSAASAGPRRVLAAQLERIVAGCGELRQPRYTPTWWASHRWVNMVWFVTKQHVAQLPGFRLPLRREGVPTPDGGAISVDFCDTATTRALPPDAPIVLLLPTLLGHVRLLASAAAQPDPQSAPSPLLFIPLPPPSRAPPQKHACWR